MAQKLNEPKSEYELKVLLDSLYIQSKKKIENEGKRPAFKGLLEIIASETVILTAIHKIKANKGSKTPGSDGLTIQNDILEKQYEDVIQMVKGRLANYKPNPVRRVYIPKPGKQEKRPLGIPSIIDRIIQECLRMVLEPILEAQFFKHSYGFRPMRDAHMAIQRIADIVHDTGYHWVIEGDISKFFDTVNHTTLIKRLWGMGIRDKRVLIIIKEMLKAGVMNEITTNTIGTPQGGIISPLLGNVYLDALDQWILREWENKRTRYQYSNGFGRYRALKRASNLKPAFLVRYADDWVLVTDSKENAIRWKRKITTFLKNSLKIELSEEKTLITNLRKKPINFLGFHYKQVKGKGRQGWITRTYPDKKRLEAKAKEIHKQIKNLKKSHIRDKTGIVHEINLINSKIRGVIEYYQQATAVSKAMHKYAWILRYAGYKSLKKYGVKWVPSNEVHNLPSVHLRYRTGIPAIECDGMTIGLTDFTFNSWKMTERKNPLETPYTVEGRKLYRKRTEKKPLLVRADEMLSENLSLIIGKGNSNPIYNFEYFLNRAYCFNRDKGKCRICGEHVESHNVEIHHMNPRLPLDQVNKVAYLATMHRNCHRMIHSDVDYSDRGNKVWKKILKFREILKN